MILFNFQDEVVFLNGVDQIEWRVIQAICIGEGEYLLILDGFTLKIMARVLSTHPVNPADILSPDNSGRYIINGINRQMTKFISATELNTMEWCSLTS